ncbi:MAG TPA: hypothetical protein VLB86_13645 [Gaiellaceae bacterium]|nr:hypothetical protein [Gaiellaceae bacterium]
MTAEHRAQLARAKARLDALDLYARPVSLRGVRIVVAPWFFRVPGLRRYHGYALVRTILLRRRDASDDLVTHELCHVWQMQRRPLHVTWTWLVRSYRSNPYELEARRAAAATSAAAAIPAGHAAAAATSSRESRPGTASVS